ncbi:hypothetical protein CCYA_CCYA05G1544 [Cyanidiococcus yangmingshanensis]|nr:hypothetical protein CCYA_CCYA05G1544 [Cyanidiococcus yangmingshanensis]
MLRGDRLRQLQAQPFFRVGLPFLTLMVASLYGVTYLLEGRYELDRTRRRAEARAASSASPLLGVALDLERSDSMDQTTPTAEYVNKPVPGRGRTSTAADSDPAPVASRGATTS